MKKIALILALALLPVILFSQVEIKMEESGGVYYVPCKVNGLPLKLIFDTGASDVSISATEAVFMLKNGYLSSEDMHGTTYSSIANGDIVEGTEITIKEIEIGGITIKNVSASVVHSLSAPLLLGQSAIQKLGPIHLNGNILTIENGLKPKSNKEATLLYGKVFQYIEAEEYDNAIETAIKAIDIAEDNMIKAVLYGELGNAYKGKGQLEAAAEACRTALTFYPYKSAAYNLGIYLNDLEKYEQAYKAFKQYLTLQAGMPENDDEFLAGAYATMGVIDYKRGRYVDAESNCKKSLKYSEHSLPYLTLGDIYKQQEKYNDAATCYDKGIRFEPERPSNIRRLIDLSDCYLNLRELQNALDCCKYAKYLFATIVDVIGFDALTDEIAESGIEATERLAHMHFLGRQWTGAIDLYEYLRGLKVPMKESDYVYLAYSYSVIKDLTNKNKVINEGLQYYPNNSELLFIYIIDKKESQETINVYMRILENEKTYTPMFFDYATVYNNIAYAYCLLGEYSKGLEYSKKSISLNQNHWYSWDTLGEIYYRLSKYEDCVSAMTKAISIRPEKNSYKLRGEAYIKLGNKKQGDKDLKIASEMKE